jgi:hypothetical protein
MSAVAEELPSGYVGTVFEDNKYVWHVYDLGEVLP